MLMWLQAPLALPYKYCNEGVKSERRIVVFEGDVVQFTTDVWKN